MTSSMTDPRMNHTAYQQWRDREEGFPGATRPLDSHRCCGIWVRQESGDEDEVGRGGAEVFDPEEIWKRSGRR